MGSTDKFEMKVRTEETSHLQKNSGWTRYILAVETKYNFLNIEDEIIPVTIFRETIRVSGDASYDKLMLCENVYSFDEYNSICDVEYIRSIYHKRNLFYDIFISPFEHLTGICLAIFVLTVVFCVKINLLFSIVFFVATYFLTLILNTLVGKIGDSIFKKIFGVENNKKEFDQILSEKYINEFYKSDILQAYNNEVIRDEL